MQPPLDALAVVVPLLVAVALVAQVAVWVSVWVSVAQVATVLVAVPLLVGGGGAAQVAAVLVASAQRQPCKQLALPTARVYTIPSFSFLLPNTHTLHQSLCLCMPPKLDLDLGQASQSSLSTFSSQL